MTILHHFVIWLPLPLKPCIGYELGIVKSGSESGS